MYYGDKTHLSIPIEFSYKNSLLWKLQKIIINNN